MSEHVTDDIQTTMGRAFWNKLNQEHGSSTWGPAIDYIYLIEQEMIAKITKEIEYWHMAGCMMGNKCDRGLCSCSELIGHIRSKDGTSN